MVDPGSIPGIKYGPHITSSVIPEHKAKSKPPSTEWVCSSPKKDPTQMAECSSYTKGVYTVQNKPRKDATDLIILRRSFVIQDERYHRHRKHYKAAAI